LVGVHGSGGDYDGGGNYGDCNNFCAEWASVRYGKLNISLKNL
jgi:hypothetical protein